MVGKSRSWSKLASSHPQSKIKKWRVLLLRPLLTFYWVLLPCPQLKYVFPCQGKHSKQSLPGMHAQHLHHPPWCLCCLPHGISRYKIINNINHYTSFSFISLYLFTLETGFLSCCPQTHQIDLEITTIFFNQPSKYRAYRCDSLLI